MRFVISNISKVVGRVILNSNSTFANTIEIESGDLITLELEYQNQMDKLLDSIGFSSNLTSLQYLINGEDVRTFSPIEQGNWRSKKIRRIQPQFGFISSLTFEENLQLPLTYLGLSKSLTKQMTNQLIEDMELEHLLDRQFFNLYRREQLLLYFARAIVTHPDLVLVQDFSKDEIDQLLQATPYLDQLIRYKKLAIVIAHTKGSTTNHFQDNNHSQISL